MDNKCKCGHTCKNHTYGNIIDVRVGGDISKAEIIVLGEEQNVTAVATVPSSVGLWLHSGKGKGKMEEIMWN